MKCGPSPGLRPPSPRFAGRGRLAPIAALLLLSFACRTARPPAAGEHPIAALSAPTAEAALQALREERSSLAGVRALLRVSVNIGTFVQSFKATVDVYGNHMEMTAFTPLGTTAMAITADGEKVHVHDVLGGKDWDGTAADLSRLVGIFPPGVPPADMVWLLLGYPTVTTVVATPTGLASATVGELTIHYDPPVHPPQKVTVTSPRQRVEATVLEVIGR